MLARRSVVSTSEGNPAARRRTFFDGGNKTHKEADVGSLLVRFGVCAVFGAQVICVPVPRASSQYSPSLRFEVAWLDFGVDPLPDVAVMSKSPKPFGTRWSRWLRPARWRALSLLCGFQTHSAEAGFGLRVFAGVQAREPQRPTMLVIFQPPICNTGAQP